MIRQSHCHSGWQPQTSRRELEDQNDPMRRSWPVTVPLYPPVRGPLLAGCLQVAGAGEPSPANGIQAPGPSSFALLEPPRVGRAPVAGVDSDSESELRLELQSSTHQPTLWVRHAHGRARLRCAAAVSRGTRRCSAVLGRGCGRSAHVVNVVRATASGSAANSAAWAELGLPHALD
jgi:hypothetical protein